jgi:hypothetical protein
MTKIERQTVVFDRKLSFSPKLIYKLNEIPIEIAILIH